MSKKLSVLISPLFVVSMLLGCAKSVPEIYKHNDNTDPITICGKELKLEFTTEQYNKDVKFADDLVASIKEGKDTYREISNKINEYYDITTRAEREYRKAYIISCMTVDNADMKVADDAYAATIKLNSYLTKIVVAIYQSKYKSNYFKGMSDQEIENYMKSFDENKNEALSEAMTRHNNIKTQYFVGERSICDAVRQFVSCGNEIAVLEGYDNFVNYSYEKTYQRSYKVSDTKNLIDYAREYIYPIHYDLYTYVQGSMAGLSEAELTTYNELHYGCFTKQLDLYDSFARDLGGNYNKNYKYLFNSGNYFLSEKPNPTTTAYTWDIDGEPLIFFGGGYQDVGTLAHEFGHYNASRVGSDVGVSYDLCEVHSQGSEAMFYNYARNVAKENKRSYDLFFADRMDNFLTNFYVGVMINELEIKLYSQPDILNMSDDEIVKIVSDIVSYIRKGEEGISTNVNGILDILLVSPIYYISYSTSVAASLELMAEAYKDYKNAKGMYNKIYANYRRNTKINDFMDVVSYAGLSNVFEEQAYKNINSFAKSFLEYLDK